MPVIRPHRSDGLAKPWIDHVHRLYPGEAAHILNFLAFTLQHPSVKINHAVVLAGDQGIGKNLMLQPLEQLRGFTRSTTMDMVMAGFNEWLEAKLVITNEASQLKQHTPREVQSRFKKFWAAPPERLELNGKWAKVRLIPNLQSHVLTTNHLGSLHIDERERHVMVCLSEIEAPDPAYFATLGGWLTSEGWRDVLEYLMGRDVTRFNPKAPPPRTAALEAMRELSMDTASLELREHLEGQEVVCLTQLTNTLKMVDPNRWNHRTVTVTLHELGWVKVNNDGDARGKWAYGRGKVVIYVPRGVHKTEAKRLVLAWLKANKPE
jgi:hypothetical protein